MEQTARKVTPQIPVVQYDLAALQLKLFALASIVEDQEKALGALADRIQALEERVSWIAK